MIGLIFVGAVAGFLAGVSPCILPVLPVVLVAGATQPPAPRRPRPGQSRFLLPQVLLAPYRPARRLRALP